MRSWDEVSIEDWQIFSTLIDLGVLHGMRMEFALTQLQHMRRRRLGCLKESKLLAFERLKCVQERLKEWIAGVGEKAAVVRELEKLLDCYEY